MTSTAPITIRTSSASDIILSTVKHVTKRHPGKVGLWALGLVIAIFASGFKPSPESVQRSVALLYWAAEINEWTWNCGKKRNVKSQGFMWSCNTDECKSNREDALYAKNEFENLYRDYKRKLVMTNKELGLFSTNAVHDAKELFWSKAAGGKRLAKRATIWDAIFIGIGSMGRDDSLMEWLIRVFFQLLMNLTMGIIFALIGFLWSVWEVILAYGANPWTATLFFTFCLLGACSLVITWLAGLVGVGIGSVYYLSKVAQSNARIEGQRRARMTQGGGYQYYPQRPHYQ